MREALASMVSTRITLGSCVRQQASTISIFLADVERVKEKASELRLVLFENDSSDGTRRVLEEWARGRDFVTIVGRKNMRGIRTERLAECRNTILHHAVRDHADYLVMVDSDYTQHIDTASLVRALVNPSKFTAQFANSEPYHYDVWALRHSSYANGDVWRGGTFAFFSRWPFSIPRGSQPVAVRSAFNGIGVYRMAEVRRADCQYVGRYPDGYPICEHVPFHECLRTRIPNATLVINPSIRTTTRSGSLFGVPGIHWLACAGGPILIFLACRFN